MGVRLVTVDVFIMHVAIFVIYLLHQPALDKQGKGAIYGGLGDLIALVAQSQIKFIHVEMIVDVEDLPQDDLPLLGIAQPLPLDKIPENFYFRTRRTFHRTFVEKAFQYLANPWLFCQGDDFGDIFKDMRVVETARRVLRIEIEGLESVYRKLGPSFERAVELILGSRGRVVVTGLGKSGLVGRKIAATLSSTGTPAFFLHPAEALHGDLGMVTREDVLLALSNSGRTEEVNLIVQILKRRGVKTVAFTGNGDSPLARMAEVVIDVGVPREACPYDLAPTASTTAALAVGDALAVALAEARGFGPEDFRRNHPAGSLGERLRVRVAEIMLTEEHIPRTRMGTLLRDALPEMDRKGLGCILVLDDHDHLRGIITDGDLRRALLRRGNPEEARVEEIMTPDPKRIRKDRLASEALDLMEKHLITVLPVVDEEEKLVGILHLHDILGKGSFKFTV